jgi:hypothetical protein
MKELIGYTIKSHDNKYVGKVTQVEPLRVAKQFRKQFGIEANEPYIAYAVEIEGSDSPTGWTTLIARDGMEIHKRYVV